MGKENDKFAFYIGRVLKTIKSSAESRKLDMFMFLGFYRPRGPKAKIMENFSSEDFCKLENLEISYYQYYQIMIEYIRHENDLINHRTTWFLATQVFIAAAAGYVFSKYAGFLSKLLFSNGIHPDLKGVLISIFWVLLCFFGLIVAATCRNSIDAATYAKHTIKKLWEETADPDWRKCFPSLTGGKTKTIADGTGSKFAGHLPSLSILLWWLSIIFIPFAFTIKTIVVILIGLH